MLYKELDGDIGLRFCVLYGFVDLSSSFDRMIGCTFAIKIHAHTHTHLEIAAVLNFCMKTVI